MPKGSRVLMADDDKMLIDMYQERLELAGYIVTVCRNGEEALEKIREAKPDIILLDIMMPKVNGYEALASVKSDPSTKDIPVIMLSALMRDFNREKAVEAGADDYLIKSEAMPADVITKIEQVLTKYGKGTIPVPGLIVPPESLASNIPAPSATPLNTPVATPEPLVMQPDAIEKKDLPETNKVVFDPAPDPAQIEPAVNSNQSNVSESNGTASQSNAGEEKKEEDVPVVKLDEQKSAPTMAWEADPDKDLRNTKDHKSASMTLMVVLAILVTTLLNDIVIYFFFFVNKTS